MDSSRPLLTTRNQHHPARQTTATSSCSRLAGSGSERSCEFQSNALEDTAIYDHNSALIATLQQLERLDNSQRARATALDIRRDVTLAAHQGRTQLSWHLLQHARARQDEHQAAATRFDQAIDELLAAYRVLAHHHDNEAKHFGAQYDLVKEQAQEALGGWDACAWIRRRVAIEQGEAEGYDASAARDKYERDLDCWMNASQEFDKA